MVIDLKMYRALCVALAATFAQMNIIAIARGQPDEVPPGPVRATDGGTCPSLAGTFRFSGESIESQDIPHPRFDMQVLRSGFVEGNVSAVRLSPLSHGLWKAEFLGEGNISVLAPDGSHSPPTLQLKAHCIAGAWEHRKTIRGSSDGSAVMSNVQIRITTDDAGALVSEYRFDAKTQGFLGLDRHASSGVARYRFGRIELR
ncbi:MAG: hypothetical protein KF738_16820 [Burkholderiales bacterium]|nr:hypothetical protein [Burkholderiales bacterium]